MNGPPATLFTAPPHWQWLIICYFFVGGLAGGSYFLAAMMDLVGGPAERALARRGYYVALTGAIVSAILLTADLRRPLRFWHMLFESHRGWFMFKPWSPMSIGSWALFAFGFFALLGVLAALAETGRLPLGLGRLRPPGLVGAIVVIVGGLLAFFVAGYTGVLLDVTNRPIWADTNLLGLVFLVSAASTSGALLLLVAPRVATVAVTRLRGFDRSVLALELLVLLGLLASLGGTLRVWLNGWGLLFGLGVLLVGVLIPLVLDWRPHTPGHLAGPVAALLVLLGGFILRVVIVLSSEAV